MTNAFAIFFIIALFCEGHIIEIRIKRKKEIQRMFSPLKSTKMQRIDDVFFTFVYDLNIFSIIK